MDGLLSKRARVHPALTLTHGLSSNVYRELFDPFFTRPIYERWHQGEAAWQLHCIGGPGSGKTTLAAIVTKRLNKSFRDQGLPIISIFIQEDVFNDENEFLEDFLHALYSSLGDWASCTEKSSEEAYEEYMQARYVNLSGSRMSYRVILLRKALYARLEHLRKSSRSFLILDGIDRCSPTLRLLLEAELLQIQLNRMSILLTTRMPVFDNEIAFCDHLNHGDAPDDDPIDPYDRQVLDTFLICKNCASVLCFPCKHAGRICGNCMTNIYLHEPYEYVNLRVSAPDHAMKAFIAWDLEREHGDLGLGSTARKPPLSSLGLSIRKNKNPNTARDIADKILGLALGHVGFAKARLDLVHEAHSVEDVFRLRYQLPSNIVSMLDAGMEAIIAQKWDRRELSLMAIAASARNRDLTGLPVPQMQELIHQTTMIETRSGEDMIEAARGFLSASLSGDPQELFAFHETFLFYVVERYCESLHYASLALAKPISHRKPSSYHEIPADQDTKVRFEPQTVSEEPAAITQYRLKRTVTTMETVTEVPSVPYVIRKGTRAWN